MFSLYEKLERSLLDCLNRAVDATRTPLIFGHICWGHLSRPGALRMTKIIATPESSSPLEQKRVSHNINHERAFRRHIRRFGRSGTLLDWLTLWMYSRSNFSMQMSSTSRNRFSFLISQANEEPCFKSDDNSLQVNSSFLESSLLPAGPMEAYATQLYTGQTAIEQDHSPSEIFEYAAEQMIGARSDALRLILSHAVCKESLQQMSNLYETRDVLLEYRSWVFLGALQTGLMYVLLAGPQRIGFTSVGHCYNIYADKPPTENPLVILSAVMGDANLNFPDLQDRLENVMNDHSVETIIRAIAHYRDRPEKRKLAQIRTNRWKGPKVDQILLREMPSAFQISAFPGWTPALMLWLSLVAEYLRETVHEGQGLNFCFVVADKSQILDSGSFEVVDLVVSDLNQQLLPWNQDGTNGADFEDVLASIKRQIGKKNYAWFQDGKYALLWDATFPSTFPRSLIRLKDSSWDVFVSHVRMNKKGKLHDLVGALAFVRGDGSGGVIVRGNQLLSFRKGQSWVEGGGTRETKLETFLRNAFENWALSVSRFKEVLDVTTRALLAISEDPHAGCMLIIFGRTDTPTFHCMGDPWCTEHEKDPLRMTLDEITSLMSMDGATCLYLTDAHPTIEFRRLVKPPDGIVGPTQTVEHLDGEGTRKWSGYFAAGRSDVRMVISVSQDGPINVFHRDPDSAEVIVEPPF